VRARAGTANAGDRLFQAPNRAQNFRVEFDENGIKLTSRSGVPWHWGLTLEGMGAPGDIRPVPSAERVANGNRVEYRRGRALTKWYINDARGLE
jgi:hypothetical protein